MNQFIQDEIDFENSIPKIPDSLILKSNNVNNTTNTNTNTNNLSQHTNAHNENGEDSLIEKKLIQEGLLETEEAETWHPKFEFLIEKYAPNNPEIIERCNRITMDIILKQRLQRLLERDERAKKLSRDEYLFFHQCCRISFMKPRKKFIEWLKKYCQCDERFEFKMSREVQDVVACLLYRHLENIVKEARKQKPQHDVALEPEDVQRSILLQMQSHSQI